MITQDISANANQLKNHICHLLKRNHYLNKVQTELNSCETSKFSSDLNMIIISKKVYNASGHQKTRQFFGNLIYKVDKLLYLTVTQLISTTIIIKSFSNFSFALINYNLF